MSDNWIALIPKDPRYVPDGARQNLARDRFAEIAPDADEIEIKVTDKISFFDCGANFERICCPSCNSEISTEWWQDRMDDDYVDGGFTLAGYETPCCNARHSLDQLLYEWPQGFARFAIDAMNPNIGKLSNQHETEFEDILGTSLRVIYQHI
ncbi:hypothetical protein [Rosistilla oblonga]|uniref:Uncharacterized protein n=1 Tax=Rosistilla oblonga TaxID=2527990 RepID=A0A518J114_9BACT|nr:hypothetical protein [Rosistilla oblonga]QDV59029.1 hypothetical protein Mal33_50540 [Rosistilla oblonga]